MRRIAFIVAVLGIVILLVMLGFQGREVLGASDLDDLELNEKVVLEGVVEGERDFGDFRILSVNSAEVICECSIGLVGEEVRVVGLVSEFNGKKQIDALNIVIIK